MISPTIGTRMEKPHNLAAGTVDSVMESDLN